MGKNSYKKYEAVESRVNDKPPTLPIALVTRPKLLDRIAMDTRLLDLDNLDFIHKLYKIHVTRGKTSTFRSKPLPLGKTNFEQRQMDALGIERDNLNMHKKLINVRPKVPTTEASRKEWEILKKVIKSKMRWPESWLKKEVIENVAVQPPLSTVPQYITEKSMKFTDKRPRVYMEVFLKDHQCIGKCLFVLYSDYEPKLCREFLETCNYDCKCHCWCKKFQINNIFPNLFCTIEGFPEHDVDIEDISMEDVPHFLHHGATGVLSISRYQTNRFSYIITFKSLPCMDGKYIAFGKIIKGIDTIRGIESFGTKNGHPLKELTIKELKEI